MTCPICGRVYCDHSPAERGQSDDEMMADCYGMSIEEYRKRTVVPSKKKKTKKKATQKTRK